MHVISGHKKCGTEIAFTINSPLFFHSSWGEPLTRVSITKASSQSPFQNNGLGQTGLHHRKLKTNRNSWQRLFWSHLIARRNHLYE